MDDFINSEMNKMNAELSDIWPEWRVVRIIGKGNFGSVYEIQRNIGSHTQSAALKVIHVSAGNSGIDPLMMDTQDSEHTTSFYREYVGNLQNEIILMQQFIGNSHIISYEDHFIREKSDVPEWDIYIRMELLTGLQEYLKAHKPDQELVLKLGKDISQGLSDCHREGIIHRDVKPQNIFINKAGNFKIGDFGISRLAPTKLDTLSFKGTVAYMAPEVFHLEGTDARSDIYSLGMVLYQLLNDYRPPFLPENFVPDDFEKAKEMRFAGEKIPYPAQGSPELKKAVCKALESDPRNRFQTAEEMNRVLEMIDRKEKTDAWESVIFNDVDSNEDVPEQAGDEKEDNRSWMEGEEAASYYKEPGTRGETEPEWTILPDPGERHDQYTNSMEREYDHAKDGQLKGRKSLPLFILAAIAIFGICIAAKVFLLDGKKTDEGVPEATSGAADTGIDYITEDDFAIDWKDPVLEAKMREVTGINTGDIMYSDVQGIKELNLDNDEENDAADSEKISDISALSNLTNLTSLNLYNNQISDISPLASLTNLNELNLSKNQITDISSLRELTEIIELRLSYNQIEDFSVLGNLKKLERLYLGGNQISDISFLKSMADLNLTHLYLYENQITDISALSGFTKLTLLHLYDNRISDISPLENLTNLNELNLSENQITDIEPLRGMSEVIELRLSYNQIKDFSALGDLKNLERLYLGGNEISDISFLNNMSDLNLTHLYLYENQITDISALSGFINLTHLHLYKNQIADISPLEGLTNLTELVLYDNKISDIQALSGMKQLNYLNLTGNQITDYSPIESLDIEKLITD